ARPQVRGTDFHTRHPVDPSRETSHPGGHTPSQAFSMQTAPSPFETVRRGGMSDSDFRDATAAPKPKSKAPLLIGVGVLLAAIAAGVVLVPKLMNNSGSVPNLPATVNNNRPTANPTTQQPASTTPSTAPQESVASQENPSATQSAKSTPTEP